MASKTSQKKYSLTYFDGKGRAEVCRLTMIAAGVEFEDIRISFEEWGSMKAKTPLGSLPILKDLKTQEETVQSLSIAKAVARESKFDGENDQAKRIVDQILDTARDLMEDFFKIAFEKDEAKKATLQASWGDNQEKKLKFFETYVKKYGGDYAVGKKPTVADVQLYVVLEGTKSMEQLSSYPCLKKAIDNFKKLTKVKAYLEKRKQTEF